MMLYKLYKFITIILFPLINLYILNRKKQGKEDSERFYERYGKTSEIRPRGKLIWINAASVGESLSVIPIIKKITMDFEDISVLVTSTTVTSANLLKLKLPSGVIHQYMPIDVPFIVDRFLSHWNPDLAIFTESELWPNFVYSTYKICPMILLNARISNTSYKRWSYILPLASSILEKFTIILPQGFIDKERLVNLGAKNLYYIGNLKYASPALNVDETKLSELKNMIGIDRKIFVAASTHKNEEEMIAKIHIELKKKNPNLLTIIVPRHTTRSLEIANYLKKLKINYSIRSDLGVINDKTDIYLADTMGELGVFYSLADVVFVGGSLIPQGGHNPIEPAYFNCAIIVGPFTFNFKEIVGEFSSKNAILSVSDDSELLNKISELFDEPEKLKEYAFASKKLVEEARNILDITVEKIMSYIRK